MLLLNSIDTKMYQYLSNTVHPCMEYKYNSGGITSDMRIAYHNILKLFIGT